MFTFSNKTAESQSSGKFNYAVPLLHWKKLKLSSTICYHLHTMVGESFLTSEGFSFENIFKMLWWKIIFNFIMILRKSCDLFFYFPAAFIFSQIRKFYWNSFNSYESLKEQNLNGSLFFFGMNFVSYETYFVWYELLHYTINFPDKYSNGGVSSTHYYLVDFSKMCLIFICLHYSLHHLRTPSKKGKQYLLSSQLRYPWGVMTVFFNNAVRQKFSYLPRNTSPLLAHVKAYEDKGKCHLKKMDAEF